MAEAAGEFRDPLNGGADPTIVFHDGNYYVSTTQGDRLSMWKSPSLAGLITAPKQDVWVDSDAGRNQQVWAPAMQRFEQPDGAIGRQVRPGLPPQLDPFASTDDDVGQRFGLQCGQLWEAYGHQLDDQAGQIDAHRFDLLIERGDTHPCSANTCSATQETTPCATN